MNNQNLRVGVVGYGGAFNMGKAHLNEMQKAGMIPTAVAELDEARLEVAAKDFPGIQTYRSLTAMLKKSGIQLVTIITPHNTHAKLGLEALRAGRHCVLEKPMAMTTAECDALIAAAKKNRVVLSTYHNRHWDGHILNAVKLVRDGVLGDIFRVEAHMGGYGKPGDWWRTSKSISGGILYDWGVHLLEYSLQLINSDIVEVTGFARQGFWGPQTKWKADANEDEGFAVVRFKNGALLTLLITTLENNPRPGILNVTGTKAAMVMDWPHCEVIRRDGNSVISTKYKNPQSEGWRFYQNMADHIAKGEKLVITGEWARRPIHILDLANRSAAAGHSLRAKYR
jgi:predicted dehydrogenase